MNHQLWAYSKKVYDENHPEEMQELLDFANMVFSMSYGGTDFSSLLPKAYTQKRWNAVTHHMIQEGSRIRALIDCYPLVMKLGSKADEAIKAVYVGTVSVHPASRGKGYMIELMKRVEEDAVQQGCALMLLDGDRHRYQYFGFEHAGTGYRYQIEQNNIRHCCAQMYSAEYMASPVYSFEELEENSPYLAYLYGLYQRSAVTARTKETFLLSLQSYNATAYAILKGGAPAGYINLSGDEKTILEMEIDDLQELPRVLYDLMMGMGIVQLSAKIGVDETAKRSLFEKMYDNCSVVMSHQIKILDYEAVLQFLLSWKRKYSTLEQGSYVIGVQKEGISAYENYLLSVAEEQICVSRTDRAADLVLGELELVRTLTTSCCLTAGLRSPDGWFPLPFYLPAADTF
ncbi:MAG: GNAT family N-acetyltransferase [Lachnospiraceae bacterium]|nr:GNAT family N-acetyltransferase [Lachnospiraceae bacterium]